MKAKFITSFIVAILAPWSYFIFIKVQPLRTYGQSGKESTGGSGIASFMEYHGVIDSLIIYGKAFLVCAVLVYVACIIYETIAKKCAIQP